MVRKRVSWVANTSVHQEKRVRGVAACLSRWCGGGKAVSFQAHLHSSPSVEDISVGVMIIPGNGKAAHAASGFAICPGQRSPCSCGNDSDSARAKCAAASFQNCRPEGYPCFGSCKHSGAWSLGRTVLKQPTRQRKNGSHPTYSPPRWEAGTIPFSVYYRVFEWISRGSVDGFGLIFASAAQCAVNICNSGTCYEHGTAQICVCPLPFKGPTCAEKASLCVDDCGIRTNSGVDCQSALCSLGSCVDTDAFPFFKCECGDFYQGTNCEVPSNPCTGAVNPCGQGTCIFAAGKGTGTVTCQCHDDWEVAPGVGVVTTKWGNSEVVMNPPCSVRVSRGLANIPFTLSSGELVFWWTVFATAVCFLLWCCYTVASESCGSCFKKFKIAGQVQKAAGG